MTSVITPEIWLPTSTNRSGVSEPLAVTDWMMSPRSTVTVLSSGRASLRCLEAACQ
ncbi:MAG: hypothetical protein M5U12_13660 [Verrucomicrobia bacterium]|nr:hypothetical protein [Verrucomicrobiota bacterium]